MFSIFALTSFVSCKLTTNSSYFAWLLVSFKLNLSEYLRMISYNPSRITPVPLPLPFDNLFTYSIHSHQIDCRVVTQLIPYKWLLWLAIIQLLSGHFNHFYVDAIFLTGPTNQARILQASWPKIIRSALLRVLSIFDEK